MRPLLRARPLRVQRGVCLSALPWRGSSAPHTCTHGLVRWPNFVRWVRGVQHIAAGLLCRSVRLHAKKGCRVPVCVNSHMLGNRVNSGLGPGVYEGIQNFEILRFIISRCSMTLVWDRRQLRVVRSLRSPAGQPNGSDPRLNSMLRDCNVAVGLAGRCLRRWLLWWRHLGGWRRRGRHRGRCRLVTKCAGHEHWPLRDALALAPAPAQQHSQPDCHQDE